MSTTTKTATLPRMLSFFESPGPIDTPTPGVLVWLARDPQRARPVLVKRLPTHTPRARVTEALGLDHPGVVRARRWMLDTDGLYVVRDVVRGKNLRQFLPTLPGRPDTEMLRGLFNPIVDALAYVHERGTAHGGISFENVLVTEDRQIVLADFGTADPSAPQHKAVYENLPLAEGDVRAVGALLAALLPVTGPFASPVVRSRIEGICLRCANVSDLRETLLALDRLATAPLPKMAPPVAETPKTAWQPNVPQPLFGPSPSKIAPAVTTGVETPTRGIPKLVCAQPERSLVPSGGGGMVAVDIKNAGDATLIVRMVATQHAWLNLRPTTLPIVVPPGGATRIGLVVSAARLAPGEYRSEIYLSTNAVGPSAEDLRTGWYRHTFEVRVSVAGGAGWRNNNGNAGWP